MSIFDKSEISQIIEEPSILSSDPVERKLARRLRIQRRIEERDKQIKAQDQEIEEITDIEKQIFDSIEALEKLTVEGDEVIAGVKIASDAKELERRKEVEEKRQKLLEILEEENKIYMEKYDEITKKWPDILALKHPLDIHDEIELQNAKGLEILKKKDDFIALLKEELENADLMFAEDVKKQNEDINLLIERMESQVKTMTKAYRHEMELIETVIESERKIMMEISMEKWNVLYKKLQEDTFEEKEKRKEIIKEYEKEMEKVIIEHQEEFRKQKIMYELEIQNLQQEVQNMKALCIMNVEKLDYNFAVLKRRDEENTIVKNQQKRKINKLQDVINNLKKTHSALEESKKAEIQKLTNQILKSQKSVLELEKKSDYLAIINDKKYMQVWDMNIKTANELIDKILTADRIIHEQLLLLEWQPPEEQLLKKEDLPSYCGAMCALKTEQEEAKKRRTISKLYKPPTTLEEINLERRLLNHIFKLISNQCDYLIEDTLKILLSEYTEENNLLIRLDKVFEALKITNEQELQFLLNFFLPYAHCPTCIIKIVKIPSEEITESSSLSTLPEIYENDFDTEEIKLIGAVKAALYDESKTSDKRETETQTKEIISEESSLIDSTGVETYIASTCISEGIIEITDAAGESKRLLTCDKGHLLAIETEFVLNAVKEFVERCEFVRKEISLDKDAIKEKITVSRNITEKDIIDFWERYRNIFSKDKEKLWDNLLVGLKQYYEVLKERHKLNAEIKALRKQNTEMRRLLSGNIPEPEIMQQIQKDIMNSTFDM
ncbi:dynein regulatory complex protein 1 [Apis cerana]|uniref:Coiled-coil domain-containing protein n=1 Tax=Apis cerana cerana TaxID=94128 RepID=A0A2A3E9K3_APICC|nr:dynein regulatory complex protein 1 [Apis cerana]PBC28405.1 coiled-coil domain-containing protein [Apis cerana cerana]